MPVDGNMPNLTVVKEANELQSDEQQQDDDGTHSSFVPITVKRKSEKEAVQKAVKDRQKSKTVEVVPWPARGNVPLNEFITEGYISCAFPTLLPTGDADFLAPRQRAATVGNYFKHLLRYEDGRFAKHPRFRYFALNTEMRWRALQNGRIYIKQHPKDAYLSLSDLKEMVSSGGEQFTKRVLHYASSLRGTRQYWFQQTSRLISMIDTLGTPTVFFTHSAADTQWPELAMLIAADPESSSSRSSAINENPAIADYFFHERITKFMKYFYVDILGATDFWFRFEWQHRGSPHVHGVAWLQNAPQAEQLLSADDDLKLLDAVEQITSYVNSLVSTMTMNPGIPADSNNIVHAVPIPNIKEHVCNRKFLEIDDLQMDLVDLVATCQRHTRCSSAY